MSSAPRKRCIVAYATRERQLSWTLELAAESTIAEALAAARVLAGDASVPWDSAAVGIFGELRNRDAVPLDGDRIEIYRPLAADPRERRRQRLRQRDGSSGGGASGT